MGKTRDLFKKIRDTKGTFHARMGTTKDRNCKDLIEAEYIKKRWQEYTEELYRKDLQVSSVAQSRPTLGNPRTAVCQASLSIISSQSLLKLMIIESVVASNHLILCRPLLLLPTIFPSIWGFSNESVLRIRQPKYWSFSFSISPSNGYSELISFRMDWLDLLAVSRTHKSLLQCHSSKA